MELAFKISVNREVAKALFRIERLYDVSCALKKHAEKSWYDGLEAINELSLEELSKALIIGYEINEYKKMLNYVKKLSNKEEIDVFLKEHEILDFEEFSVESVFEQKYPYAYLDCDNKEILDFSMKMKKARNFKVLRVKEKQGNQEFILPFVENGNVSFVLSIDEYEQVNKLSLF